MDHAGIFKTQHDHIIKLIDTIVERIGLDTAKDAIRIFDIISDTAEELLH